MNVGASVPTFVIAGPRANKQMGRQRQTLTFNIRVYVINLPLSVTSMPATHS